MSEQYDFDGGDQLIKEWYLQEFPTDLCGEDLYDDITFYDAIYALDNGEEFYDFMGVGDSVVRERIFTELAFLMSVDYDFIYDKWLG